MPLTPYVCENCGFWQRWFDAPPLCPVCADVRNDLPPDGWTFAPFASVAARVRTTSREAIPGVYAFTTTPQIGLGGTGWLVVHPAGNVAYEGAAYYDAAALQQIETLGGVRYASTSHPHGCGALWQLQDRFEPELALHRDGLGWSKAFRVTRPYDETLVIDGARTLHHLGGHYEGHALLHDATLGAVFCGDAVKIERDADGRPAALSAHKAYHKQIPLTEREVRHYRATFAALDFTHVFTTFDDAAIPRSTIVAFFDALLDEQPSTRTHRI